LELFGSSGEDIIWQISWYFRILFLGGLTFVLVAYLVLAAIETIVFAYGLSPRYSQTEKRLAALWLKACSVPLVAMTLTPFCGALFRQIGLAEGNMPGLVFNILGYGIWILCVIGLPAVFEIGLFQLALRSRHDPLDQSLRRRDVITIVVANVCTSAAFYFMLPYLEQATAFTWRFVGNTSELKYNPVSVQWEREHPRFDR
jgi:hypothetical protein